MAIKIQGTTVIDDGRQLNVIGVNTISNVEISSGIVTAVSGVVTYYGDGSNLDGIEGGAAISTNTTNQAQYIPYATSFGSTTGFGATESFVFNPSTGILTAPNFSGDGSRLSNTNGFATALSSNPSDGLYGIYKENRVLTINSGIHTVESDSNQDKLAFTKADTIVISAGATLNISSGTTFRTNIINLFPADEDLNVTAENLYVSGIATFNSDIYVSGIGSFNSIGIGTTSLDAAIHVVDDILVSSGVAATLDIRIKAYSDDGGSISFEDAVVGTQYFSITQDLSEILFGVNDANFDTMFVVDASGNVGIQTDTVGASRALDVIGNVAISNDINVTGDATISGDVTVGVDTSTGIILTDSNGVSWRVGVNTDGSLETVSI